MEKQQYLSISGLTKYLKRKFDADPYLEKVFLTGEISNWRLRPTHQYFSLKDDNAKINATMFQGNFKKVKFQPEEGMKVLVTGRISLYGPSGSYQIIVDSMQPDGVGALYQAYEQLKQKLQVEGLFDRPKKSLPRFPKRIAVITSPSGAVIRDIITTTQRRYPIAQLVLYPAVVQGDNAVASLVERLHQVAQADYDVVIIGRGGGSIEDLWPFNEEAVARAIVSMPMPVISSVGHETDTTIADLVADIRAATPTAAAELATPRLDEEIINLQQLESRLQTAMLNRVKFAKQQVARQMNSVVFSNPQRLYDGYVQRVDLANERLIKAFQQRIANANNRYQLATHRIPLLQYRQQIVQLVKHINVTDRQLIQASSQILKDKQQQVAKQMQALNLVSPLNILNRGYALASIDGQVIKRTTDVEIDEQITLRVSDGTVTAKVTDIRKES
ncbi:exodeoxyribonuclease VII large subunit [Periweissella fabalis]|uniref:Exodeoxyribonuclease 7 large subunit n=1 Tax=Periweissella fabalis TaxID=1070421 RepID=A0A7X6N2W0_9LACO|nr:exodeoxyribonuclease VII large subunit [Periweissella fabalis]MCM0598669.1 exodeoxyribonuclease VII large subunit [Periweissella fabalis]NKZ24322.1 exodeoxyribonuclease VII large subunit [Periweissella fabalis]